MRRCPFLVPRRDLCSITTKTTPTPTTPEPITETETGAREYDLQVFCVSSLLCLEGPEVYEQEGKMSLAATTTMVHYHINDWSDILKNGPLLSLNVITGLTTTVRAEPRYTSMLWQFVLEQDVIRLVFLPTKTIKF